MNGRTLSRAARSILFFGYYVALLGAIFLFYPQIFHELANIGPVNVISRVFGLILLYLAFYYYQTAKQDIGMEKFFKSTVYTRGSAIFVLSIFAALGWCEWIIAGFGIVDFLGAVWTYKSLEKDEVEKQAVQIIKQKITTV